MTKPTAVTFRHITSKALERAKLTTSYALRNLFRTHGPTAVRHLTDDERRQMARLGHDIEWRPTRDETPIGREKESGREREKSSW